MYRIIINNNQGATLEDIKVNTVEEIKDLILGYQDPENLSVKVYEGDDDFGYAEVSEDWYYENGLKEA